MSSIFTLFIITLGCVLPILAGKRGLGWPSEYVDNLNQNISLTLLLITPAVTVWFSICSKRQSIMITYSAFNPDIFVSSEVTFLYVSVGFTSCE